MRSDALGEVNRALEVVEFACGIPHLLKGGFSTAGVDRDRRVLDPPAARRPVGVISPFNFPAMVPCWFFPIAIACGNTVVLKPSEKDPSASNWLGELWPRPASRTASSTSCTATRWRSTGSSSTPTCKSISFVGSTPIARYVYEQRHAGGKARAGARRGARTTWSCCPTPISTSPPTRR